MRSAAVLALATLLVLLAVGCGRGLQTGSTVPRPTELAGDRSVHSLVPRDTTTMAYVDLDGVC
ncbi:MAG: hypothetical protein ACOCUS_04585, partial [Polyangiales bacterium]